MNKKQAVSDPTHFSGATFKNPTRQRCFPFLFMFVICGLSACQKDLPEPNFCPFGENVWFVSLEVPDSNWSDYQDPLFRSGAPVNMKLILFPENVNTCPELHSLEIQLIQFISASHESERVVATLWSEVINVTDSFLLNEDFIPPAGSGTYALLATARDAEGKIVGKRKSNIFHVQQVVSEENPVYVRIYNPYNGGEVKKGDPLHYDFTFDVLRDFSHYYSYFDGKVEILDENNQLYMIYEFENRAFMRLWGQVVINTPGKYTMKASTWLYKPSTDEPYQYNVALNEFTVID